jgi:flagellar protein FlaF
VAVAGIIAAAVGVMLLIVVAYVVVGATLTAAETVSNAQKDLAQITEARLRTSITLNKTETHLEGKGLNFSVTNTGNEMITDFTHMDILIRWESIGCQHLTFNSGTCGTEGTWCIYGNLDPDTIHPNQLDPDEKMWVWATFSRGSPDGFQITTSNGVYASAYV